MPTNGDLPIVPAMAATDIATNDLIQVFDVSSGQVKTITFANLITALDTGGLAAD